MTDNDLFITLFTEAMVPFVALCGTALGLAYRYKKPTDDYINNYVDSIQSSLRARYQESRTSSIDNADLRHLLLRWGLKLHQMRFYPIVLVKATALMMVAASTWLASYLWRANDELNVISISDNLVQIHYQILSVSPISISHSPVEILQSIAFLSFAFSVFFYISVIFKFGILPDSPDRDPLDDIR